MHMNISIFMGYSSVFWDFFHTIVRVMLSSQKKRWKNPTQKSHLYVYMYMKKGYIVQYTPIPIPNPEARPRLI